MSNDPNKDTEVIVKEIEECAARIRRVATRSESTMPVWVVLNSIYSASLSAMAIMPEGHESEIKRIHQHCVESMLTQAAVADRKVETSLITSLFDELCKQGFSSQTSAVSMAGIYCRWLKARGQLAMVEEVIARVGAHIVHPKYRESLLSVVDQALNADNPTTE
jgi:hypothetical protein